MLFRISVLAFLFLFPTLLFAQPKNGMRAIDFTLKNPKGKEVSLSDYRGKVVLVDFWASWCGPCRHENKNIVEAYKKYNKSKFKNAKGFTVLSVSLDKNEKPWKSAIKTDELSWDGHVWDENSQIAKKYGITTIPYSFLVDGEGKIIAQGREVRNIGLHIEIEKLLE